MCAVPSTLDGNDTVMRPRNFQIAALARLGVPVLKKEISCSLCLQTMDIFGDHAACCTKNTDLIHRHNRLRNLRDKISYEGAMSPMKETSVIVSVVEQRVAARLSRVRTSSAVTVTCL